jgi:hypothetical protein
MPRKEQALMALVPLVAVFNFFLGPMFAMMQRLAPSNMRATNCALVMLLANLIGMGVGPQVVGVLSDGLRPVAGVESLRYAMLAVSFLALWSGWHFWQASLTVEEDIDAVTAAG